MFSFLQRLRQRKAGEVVTAPETTILSDKAEDAAVEEKPAVEVAKAPLNKGKICINNGEVNKYIGKDDPIPVGWVRGAKKK